MTASSSWNIRPAREEELDGLIELGRRSWLSAFAQTAPFALIAWWASTDRTAHLYREVWPEMRVLEDQGSLIGLVQPKKNEINGLWIHPARQGVGAGTLLLRTAEALIQSAGHRTAWLTCSAWNQAALRFYESRGYVETRRDRGLHVCGVEYEDIRMERRLDRG